MHPIPAELATRPFSFAEAVAAGVPPRALEGQRFERLHRGVYVVRGLELDVHGRITAATLALPSDAYVSHITRIQQLGLDIGPSVPLHFVVARDLHVTPRGVFLHRTKVLPPCVGRSVSPAAAFLSIAHSHRLLDAIVIGDWLLHRRHMTQDELVELAHRDSWRPGAAQALAVSAHLDGRAASPQESRSRAYLVFAGLPRPEVNVPLTDDPNSPILDLLIREFRFALEYEGGHHFLDPAQVKRDIWRYAELRKVGVGYFQVYDEILAHPRGFVMQAHQQLVARGYGGPPPNFGHRWRSLTRRIVVRSRHPRA